MGPATGQAPSWVSPCPPRFKNHVARLQRIIEGLTTLRSAEIALSDRLSTDEIFAFYEQRQHRVGRIAFRDFPGMPAVMPAWW